MSENANGDILRLARRAAGLTMKQLAEQVGCTQPRISQIENGGRPSLPLALRMARVLGVPLERLRTEQLRDTSTGARRMHYMRVHMPFEVYQALVVAANNAGQGVHAHLVSVVAATVGHLETQWDTSPAPEISFLKRLASEHADVVRSEHGAE